LITNQPALIGLQQQIGNRAVQRLLAQGRLSSHGIVQKKPEIRRCGCGGSCATCKEPEELPVSVGVGEPVQRFWDDEEEEGGSWLDDATDWASETASDAADWVSGDSSESESSEDSGGSWLDDATDWVSDTASDVTDWASDTWNDWTGGGEEPESSDTDDSGWTDWLPDWLTGEDSEGEGQDLVEITAECETEDGIGFGGARQLKLHGVTEANYNHGKPIPEPFPSSITVTTGKKGNDDVFSASGTYEAEFLATPKITLPTMPSGLTPCQEKAVQAFIDGPLTAHENAHKQAFKDNYDGKFTAKVDVKDIKDTEDNRKIAMKNPVNTEDQVRTKTANAESKKLDPWKETVSGLDCKD
jgi:hypothetical protein